MISTEEKTSARTSGYWRITERGIAFAEGKLAVPSDAIVFRNKFEGLAGDSINIADALGDKFDFEELMTAHRTGTLTRESGKKAKAEFKSATAS